MKDDVINCKSDEINLLYLEENFVHAFLKSQFVFIILLGALTIGFICPVSGQDIPSQATLGLSAASPSTPPLYRQGPPSIPTQFSGDWYYVDGGPYLQITPAQSVVYRDQETSLFLTVLNNGRVTSFKVAADPESDKPDEVYAAQQELQLEAQRSTAQDVSVRLVSQNSSAFKIKREVAYAGSVREGQVSQPLQFPIEIYENTEPGNYTIYAVANYTFQQDVAVKPHSDSPQNPDVYYWYNTASQTIPLTLQVEKMSLVDLRALNSTPGSLSIGSKNNIVKVTIQNEGRDVAKDVVARLRPETGVYVDMDESPIPALKPGEKAELVYKVDVSKDAIANKLYRFTLLFDYSDTYKKNLQDSDYIYLSIQPGLSGLFLQYWWVVVIILAILAFVAVSEIRRRRSASAN